MTNANQPRHSQDRSGSSRWPAFLWRRNIVSDVVQGIIVGGVLAFITFQIIAHCYVTHVNRWTTMYGCGEPGKGILFRAACAETFPGPINISQEAVYWTTKVDSMGQKLSGQHDYIMHVKLSLRAGEVRNRGWGVLFSRVGLRFAHTFIIPPSKRSW